ncbi:hypothetical protein MFLO_07962 [Listeria floridensis FSL S10-1187]|uniref:DUF6884 domain-containing protein n=1 Tax=Listeria floridensis FSL S10-1187 TaxID=1265817 RepID=A0ABP3AYG3_9LIST|nr:hypothetical protein MFLO_07962 [Listeria floridensis FSL S10-1187]
MMIIASGKPKIWDKQPELGAVRAAEAYTGTFHRLSQAYARKFASEYLILSPRYGFLAPDDWVRETYDVRFTIRGVNSETIQMEDLKALWKEKGCEPQELVTIVAGKKFVPLIEAITEGKNPLSTPLSGAKGIGDMQGRLKRALLSGKPLPDLTDQEKRGSNK